MIADIDSIKMYLFVMLANIILFWLFSKIRNLLPVFIRIICYILIVAPFALRIGLRNVSVGYDTYNYVHHLKLFPRFHYGEPTYRFFLLLNSLYGKDKYYLLLLIYSFLTLITITVAADILCDYMSGPTFITCFYFIFGLNMTDQIRQLASLAFLTLTLALFKTGKKKTAIVVYIISVLIHTTAIFAILLFLVSCFFTSSRIIYLRFKEYQIRVNIKLISGIIVLTGVILVWYRTIFSMLSVIGGRYGLYFTEKVNVQEFGMGWLLDALPIIFIMLYRRNQEDKVDKCLYAYSLFTIPLRIVGYFSQFVARMDYFTLLTGIMLGSQKNVEKKRYPLLIALSVVYFIIIYLIYDTHGSFPYKINPYFG